VTTNERLVRMLSRYCYYEKNCWRSLTHMWKTICTCTGLDLVSCRKPTKWLQSGGCDHHPISITTESCHQCLCEPFSSHPFPRPHKAKLTFDSSFAIAIKRHLGVVDKYKAGTTILYLIINYFYVVSFFIMYILTILLLCF